MGLVERFHGYLKAALTMRPNETDWVGNLPLIILCTSIIIKAYLGYTPVDMVFGTSLNLPGQKT